MEAEIDNMDGNKAQEQPDDQTHRQSPGTTAPLRPAPAFVMTLWCDTRAPGRTPQWRWRVIDVRSGERRYFRRLRDLLDYVAEHSGMPPPTLDG